MPPSDDCPAGQTLSQYTRDAHDSEMQFQILSGGIDETSTLLDPSPSTMFSGLFKDGPVLLEINLLPNARQLNIIVELLIMGADSVSFSYVHSDSSQSQPITVSRLIKSFYNTIF